MLPKLIALTVVMAAGITLAVSVGTSRAQEVTSPISESTTTAPLPPPTTEPEPVAEVPLQFQVFKERRIAKLRRVNTIRRNRGYYPVKFRVPSYRIAPLRRDDNLRYWNSRIERVLRLPRKCGRSYCSNLGVRLGRAVWNFRNRSDSRCVRAHEASYQEWTNPTYDGAWQADDSFELYGREGMRRWGHMTDSKPDWPAWAQDAMAYRGWLARGWQPWPTYARYCA